MLESLIDTPALLVTGKGGTGKSIVCAKLAIDAARLGKRVCIVENSFHSIIPSLFNNSASENGNLYELSENIFSINVDLATNLRDFVCRTFPRAKKVTGLFEQPIIKTLCHFLPGVDPITLLGKIYDLSTSDPANFDLVIFDGYSFGHFNKLLATPNSIIEANFVGFVSDMTIKVKNFFSDESKCKTIIVSNYEYLPLEESFDFLPKLERLQTFAEGALVLNKFPRFMDPNIAVGRNNEFSDWVDAEKNRIRELENAYHEKLVNKNVFTLSDEPVISELLYSTAFEKYDTSAWGYSHD